MSIYIERKYILLLSGNLSLFRQRKPDLFNFRCPLCGDSEKDKIKCRGFLYKKGEHYKYKCHNCQANRTFVDFLKEVNNQLYSEYVMDKYKKNDVKVFDKIIKPSIRKIPTFPLPIVQKLPIGNLAKDYVVSRKIPEEKQNLLFFAEDFKKFVDTILPDHHYHVIEDDPRLVIPFYDKDGTMIGVQGRTLKDSKMRYITIKFFENAQKIFGLERVNKLAKTYVVEGPLDSLFLNNSLATMDPNLSFAKEYVTKQNLVLVPDNQPRNKDIKRVITGFIDQGFNVCIWPSDIEEKDINDMILAGKTKEEIQKIIDDNTFEALRAKLEFNRWKR